MTVDPDKVAAFSLKVWQYKQGEVVSLMVHLGDRLGLYRALSGQGPMTAAEVASSTNLHERWVLEWLRGQAAAGLVETEDGERFELTTEGSQVLADETGSLAFAAGAFHGGVVVPEVVPKLEQAFRTGRGLRYDELGPSEAHGVERSLAPWTRLALVPRIIPALEGVEEKLRRGPAKVADVGCGAGIALVALATAFPDAHFYGYDPSRYAIERAKENVTAAGLTNVTLRRKPAEELPNRATFDFVMTLDCLHDMPHPDSAMNAIRRAIRPDGTWLIKDIRSSPRWSDNLRNPVLAMMYGFSIATCMSSALSEPGGAGLGTLGLHPELAEQMVREAGFSQFRIHDFDDPANLYYEVRP